MGNGKLQLRTHQWIQSTSYISTGRIVDRLLRPDLHASFSTFCVQIVQLLKRIGHRSHNFVNLEGLNESLIIGQFLPKRYQKKSYSIAYNSLSEYFSKIFCLMLTVGRQKLIQYIQFGPVNWIHF